MRQGWSAPLLFGWFSLAHSPPFFPATEPPPTDRRPPRPQWATTASLFPDWNVVVNRFIGDPEAENGGGKERRREGRAGYGCEIGAKTAANGKRSRSRGRLRHILSGTGKSLNTPGWTDLFISYSLLFYFRWSIRKQTSASIWGTRLMWGFETQEEFGLKRKWMRKSDYLHNWLKPNWVSGRSTDPLWCPDIMHKVLPHLQHIYNITSVLWRGQSWGNESTWQHLQWKKKYNTMLKYTNATGFFPIDKKNEWNIIWTCLFLRRNTHFANVTIEEVISAVWFSRSHSLNIHRLITQLSLILRLERQTGPDTSPFNRSTLSA